MPYKIIEIRDNSNLDRDNPSFYTFDVLTELDGERKWLSIPYELYFQWIEKTDAKLTGYIKKINLKNEVEIIKNLVELELDFKETMISYIQTLYSEIVFKKLPTYNPDKFFDHYLFEDGEDDF